LIHTKTLLALKKKEKKKNKDTSSVTKIAVLSCSEDFPQQRVLDMLTCYLFSRCGALELRHDPVPALSYFCLPRRK